MAQLRGTIISGGGGGGYSIIQEDGTSLPTETTINFTGAGVTVTDNPGVATIVNIPGVAGVAFAQMLYVDPNGSDSTGNGSVTNPYLTIGHTLSSITDSTSTKPYVVMINPGTYSETGLEVPVWVFLVGAMQQPTKIIDSSGSIKINSSSFSAGSERIGFQNLNLINSTGLDIDFQSIGGSGSNDIYLVNCQIAGNVTFLGRGSDYVTGDNNQIFGTYHSSAMQEIYFGGYFAGNCTFDTAGVTGQAIGPEFTGVDFFGNVEFTSSGSGNTMTPTMISSQVSGTLQVDAATTNLSADEVSLNAGTLSPTSGGVITFLSVAKYEGYTPAVSGNWPTVPIQVAAALDEIAATGVMGPFTAGSVIFSNGTKLTQDNANFNYNAGVLQLSQLATFSALATDGSSNVTAIASSTSGYVLTSNGAGSTPTFQPAPAGGTSWSVVTVNTTLVKSNGYFANSASLLTFTLPTTAAVGDTFSISGMNTGLFTIAQNAGQSIRLGNQISTTGTGGSIASTSIGDGITIVCNTANSGFQVMPGTLGNFNVI